MKGVVAAALTAALLGGCALISTPPEEQLYRVGMPMAAGAPSTSASAVRLGVDAGAFPREAAGVRILTVEDSRVSYLSGARWASPAPVMFETALVDAFSGPDDGVTLYGRGAAPSVAGLLRVDVRRFEALYDQGPEVAPVVTVAYSARIVRPTSRAVVAERDFASSQRATGNTVGEVVAAYQAAMAATLGETRTWAAASVGSLAAAER